MRQLANMQMCKLKYKTNVILGLSILILLIFCSFKRAYKSKHIKGTRTTAYYFKERQQGFDIIVTRLEIIHDYIYRIALNDSVIEKIEMYRDGKKFYAMIGLIETKVLFGEDTEYHNKYNGKIIKASLINLPAIIKNSPFKRYQIPENQLIIKEWVECENDKTLPPIFKIKDYLN